MMNTDSNAVANLIAQGEAAKQIGMQLAAEARAVQVMRGQLALLRALLEAENGRATMDDATDDLTAKFTNGGKWRGSIPLGLSKKRIIEAAGVAMSKRPARHRGYLTVWRLLDRDKAKREIDRIEAELAQEKSPQTAATESGQNNYNNSQTTKHGG